MTLYAHTGPDGTIADGQTLQDHLEAVAQQCSQFARDLGYEHWGYALGLLHDAGKSSEAFQRRLEGSTLRVDHATAGAQLSARHYGGKSVQEIVGTLMALSVAGHHGGMPNVRAVGKRTTLVARLAKDVADFEDAYFQLLNDADLRLPEARELEPLPVFRKDRRLPPVLEAKGASAKVRCLSFSLQLLGRLLYSCLVDADYLDAERFMTPEAAALRVREYDSPEELLERLDVHMARLEEQAPRTTVNEARALLLQDCRAAAVWDEGLFTLSVPTGGGKTLSSMEFALRHAVLHGKRRVIYAIPFTSVAQQTARVFRAVFGAHNVLEHHSAHVLAHYDDSHEGASNDSARAERLATQNWDAPIIVTTNVQLFESLYANTPSKCRKLHNVAGSVIVLDEAQSLPDELLLPTLAVLEGLCIDFDTSVVLCTATQPTLDGIWPFCSQPREIALHRQLLDQALSGRTSFLPLERVSRWELAHDLSTKSQALCVVGTKQKARELYLDVVQLAKDLGVFESDQNPADAGFFHLSTHMVAAHRMQTIETIRKRLDAGARCVVISTQLIEAGVDVDFREAYRELAGIDSLMQVAGRCNREGQLRNADGTPCTGTVHVFEFEEDTGAQGSGLVGTWLGAMRAIAKNLIQENDGVVSEKLIEPFFRERYRRGQYSTGLDRDGILVRISKVLPAYCGSMEYESYASEYQIIEDLTEAVYVPWNEEGRRLIDLAQKLAATGESAALFMPLQQYAVGVYPHVLRQLMQHGDVEDVGEYHVLVQDACLERYSQEVGLLPVGEGELNALIV